MRSRRQGRQRDRCGRRHRAGKRRSLAANGSTVYYTDIRADAVERAGVEEGVREAVRHAGRAEHVVSREESSQEGIDGVIVETGQLEIHVNIAGVNTLAYRVTSDESRSEE